MMSSTALATINFNDDSSATDNDLGECEDISLLPLPEEDIILQLLAVRYAKNRIYSKCGDVLLAINPYCDVSHLLYTDEMLFRYSKPRSLTELDTLPPHPWKTAAKAFRCLVSGANDVDGVGDTGHRNQSIVISGESGSGKSETTKIILNYLAKIGSFSNANNRTSTLADFQNLNMSGGHVQSRILQTNIILESLGNARTVRNDNSSRFGKLIQLLFHSGGKLEGACVETYLLELTRVVQQRETERNFHIFYMLLTETDIARRKSLHLEAPSSYQYLLQSSSEEGGRGCFERRDGVSDADLYVGFIQALKILSADEGTVHDMLAALTAVLTVGNFHCLTMTSADGDTIVEQTPEANQCLKLVAELLAVSVEILLTALSTRTVVAGGETFVVTLDSDNITIMRNMFAKALYRTIFEWMIRFLNIILQPTDTNTDTDTDAVPDAAEGNREKKERKSLALASIGLLDMFGFEDLALNSLEQLLINYTNEHLQQQFDFMMIESEQALYIREGIKWDFIEFPSAQHCLDLVFSRGKSLVSILDEACRAPGGSDASFIHQVYHHFGQHDCLSATPLQRGKSLFAIRHYAGLVTYDSSQFVAKNKVISFPLRNVLQESSRPFVRNLMKHTSVHSPNSTPHSSQLQQLQQQQQQEQVQSPNQTHKLVVDTVADKFCQNVNELLETIRKTSLNYIKCFKPNNLHSKQNFVHDYVKDQLKYSGILHSLTVMRIGFPIRYTYLAFWHKYHSLIFTLCSAQFPSQDAETKKTFLARLRRQDPEVIRQAIGSVVEQLTDIENAGQLVVSSAFDTGCSGRCIQTGVSVIFLRYSGYFTLQQLVADLVGTDALRIQTQYRCYYERSRYLIRYRLVINLQRIRHEYLLRKRMKRNRLVLCRFVRNVTRRVVACRLSWMLLSAFRRLRVRRWWNQTSEAIRRFTCICRFKMLLHKYRHRCALFSDIMTPIYFRRRNELNLLHAFCTFRDMDSTNYEHYIHDKDGVACAFREVITQLQRAWRWKRKLFYELFNALRRADEGRIAFIPVTKDSSIAYLRQQDRVMQTSFASGNALCSQELLRANRHILWAIYMNYVSMASTAPGSTSNICSSLDQRDRYNVPALPLKYFFTLMKDWELCPQVVNQTMITNILQLITESEYYFLDFDLEVWGRRFPPSSAPNSPSKGSSSPPKSRGKQMTSRQDSGDVLLLDDISFNMFCQLLLHLSSVLNNDTVASSPSMKASAPPAVLSVSMQDMLDLGFKYTVKVGLMLRLLLTVMDRSNGRNKLGNLRSSLPLPSLLGVVGSEDSVSKKLTTPKHKRQGSSFPVKESHDLVSHPMNTQVLTVVKSNRPQLLLIALHYSHINFSAHPRLLSEKDKIAQVHLSQEDIWDIAVDFGICPHHCSKQMLMDICDLVQAGEALKAEKLLKEKDKEKDKIKGNASPSSKSTPPSSQKLEIVVNNKLSVRTSLSPTIGTSVRAGSLSPSRPLARRGVQGASTSRKDQFSYADFIKVLHCLSLNILSKRVDTVLPDFTEKQISPLLHIMNLSLGREKMAATRRISTIAPPFHLPSSTASPALSLIPSSSTFSPSAANNGVTFSPHARSRSSLSPCRPRQVPSARRGSLPLPSAGSSSQMRSSSPHKSPSCNRKSLSPHPGNNGRVFNQTTPEPTGAAKSVHQILLSKGKAPVKEEPPDFKF